MKSEEQKLVDEFVKNLPNVSTKKELIKMVEDLEAKVWSMEEFGGDGNWAGLTMAIHDRLCEIESNKIA